jgi:hypothetical protein
MENKLHFLKPYYLNRRYRIKGRLEILFKITDVYRKGAGYVFDVECHLHASIFSSGFQKRAMLCFTEKITTKVHQYFAIYPVINWTEVIQYV